MITDTTSSAAAGGGPRLLRRLRQRIARLEILDALSVVLTVVVLAAWTAGIRNRYFDYDESEHAHVTWLVRHGLRPFVDYFEAHPPFVWYPLAALVWLSGDSYSVTFAFRIITALGHLLFLVYLARNVGLSFRRHPSPVALSPATFLVCAAAIVSGPAIIDYLVEFRLDAWPNALLLCAVYRYRLAQPRDPRAAMKAGAAFGALATATVLCTPKLAAFLACFSLLHLLTSDHRRWRVVGWIVGGLVAVGVAALVLVLGGIPFTLFWKMIYAYHQLLNQKGGFGHGLAGAVWDQSLLVAIVAASVIACLFTLRRRILWYPFELAVLGFSAFQLVAVSFRYKQYYGPWFLMAIAFIPYLDLVLRRWRPLHSLVVGVAVVYFATTAIAQRHEFLQSNEPTAQNQFRQWIQDQGPADALVAAPAEIMPLFRRSVFYHVMTSFAPSGFGTEAVMEALGLGRWFTEEGYLQELETKVPHVIILDGAFTPLQRKSIDSYLASHPDRYRRAESPRGPVFIRQR